MTVPRKEKKREARREEKAEKAAVLEKSIEKELLERLKKGVYDEIYNYPIQQYVNLLDREDMQPNVEEEEEEEAEPEIEYVEGDEELEEEEDMEDFPGFINDESTAADDSGDIDEDDEMHTSEKSVARKRKEGLDSEKADTDGRRKKLKRKGRVTIEFEHDEDLGDKQTARL